MTGTFVQTREVGCFLDICVSPPSPSHEPFAAKRTFSALPHGAQYHPWTCVGSDCVDRWRGLGNVGVTRRKRIAGMDLDCGSSLARSGTQRPSFLGAPACGCHRMGWTELGFRSAFPCRRNICVAGPTPGFPGSAEPSLVVCCTHSAGGRVGMAGARWPARALDGPAPCGIFARRIQRRTRWKNRSPRSSRA